MRSVQPLLYDLKRGPFLGDEENCFPLANKGCDEVRDCLTLSGTGGAVNDCALSTGNTVDSALLASVSIHDTEFLVGALIVEQAWVDVHLVSGHRGSRLLIASDGRDEFVFRQDRDSVLEIIHHRHLREGEVAYDRAEDLCETPAAPAPMRPEGPVSPGIGSKRQISDALDRRRDQEAIARAKAGFRTAD